MLSPRYTVTIAKHGTVRRFRVSRGLLLALGTLTLAVCGFAGLFVGGVSQTRLDALVAENEALRLQNESYLVATGELTTQISGLQAAITELSGLAEIDPMTRGAMDRLPAIVRARAMGGDVAVRAARTAPLASPERTLTQLQSVLATLEAGLTSVRSYFENQQALARATPTLWPAAGWLSSAFGNRKDPFNGSPDFHAGLDISANRGTPVRAPADGTVEHAGVNGNYGKSVLLVHGFGLGTRFGHLSSYVVRPGQRVKRGDLIGYVGATGRATSSHLHYEVLLNGSPINPLRLLARP
jgi:murein DD-endopeptidase MepM/ murein hydrolase activator NlpD